MRSVVIRFPNWIGDVAMALPVLDIARAHWPGARIGVQVHQRARSLLEGHPAVARLHPAPAPGMTRWAEAIDSLREEHYEAGVLLTPSFSSAWIFYLAGIPRRVGWTGDARRVLLTDALPKPGRKSPLPGQYQEIFRCLGYDGPERRLGYSPPPAAVYEAEEWIRLHGLTSARPVALVPAALHGPAKRWPAAAYHDLARRLSARHGYEVVVVGARDEKPLLDEVANGLSGTHVMAGAGEVSAVAAFLKTCRLVIGNDTGLLHVARAVGTPVIGIYGSTTPEWSGPYPHEGEALYLKLPCSPCFERECRLEQGRMACLERITPGEVEEAALRVLARGGEGE